MMCTNRVLGRQSFTTALATRSSPIQVAFSLLFSSFLVYAQAQRQLQSGDAGAAGGGAGGKPDFYSKLVTMPSNVYREVRKQGPMPASRYDDNLFNHTEFREWLLRTAVLKEDVPGPPPMSYRCGVYVNHHYKLIFIRNRKAASTTVLDTFKSACKQDSKLLCMKPFDANALKESGLTHDEMWMKYFVFTTARNPWARAASGYDYTQDRWPTKTGVCTGVPFSQFCRDPYHMGKLANLFRCGTQSSFRGDDAWAYDFYHVEPAHHCMTDANGGIALDFVVRYEQLQEDMEALVALLNARRDAALPEMRVGKVGWRKQGVHVQAARESVGGGSAAAASAAALIAADRHAVRYRECGMDCVRGIAKFFARDVEVMKLQVPPADGA